MTELHFCIALNCEFPRCYISHRWNKWHVGKKARQIAWPTCPALSLISPPASLVSELQNVGWTTNVNSAPTTPMLVHLYSALLFLTHHNHLSRQNYIYISGHSKTGIITTFTISRKYTSFVYFAKYFTTFSMLLTWIIDFAHPRILFFKTLWNFVLFLTHHNHLWRQHNISMDMTIGLCGDSW